MPDPNGAMTPEEFQKAKNWLVGKAPEGKCVMCGTDRWTITTAILNPPLLFPDQNFRAVSPTFPLIGIICDNCAHVEFFSAVIMGIVPSTKENKDQQPAADDKKTEVAQEAPNGR
jgi:hypothetical protein